MATDYASKKWERGGKDWATRNIKLRFSRKLVFTWGLFASLTAKLFDASSLDRATNDDEHFMLLSDLIWQQTEVTPLELLARVASQPSVTQGTQRRIFDAYDAFLAALGDPEFRRRLDTVEFDSAADDEAFETVRRASNEFREGINSLFFDEHDELRTLIRRFGVF